MKKILLIILISAFSTASNIEIKNTVLSDLLENNNSNYVQKEGEKYTNIILKRLKNSIGTAHSKATITSSKNNKTNIQIDWFINRKRALNVIGEKIPAYKGEDVKSTTSSRFTNNKERNNLYFYLAPLGQQNGLTFEKSSSTIGKSKLLTDILSKVKVFLKASYKNTEHFIPIFSGAPKKGCGKDIYTSKPEIICFQTESSKNQQFSIGYEDGFTNTFTINDTITDENLITLEILYYFGDNQF